MPVTMPLLETPEDLVWAGAQGPPRPPYPEASSPHEPQRPRQGTPGKSWDMGGRGWGPSTKFPAHLPLVETPPCHSPRKYSAHRREEPLRGVEAEDGHAVGSLQAELQAKTDGPGQPGREGGPAAAPALPPGCGGPVDLSQGPPSQRLPWGESAAQQRSPPHWSEPPPPLPGKGGLQGPRTLSAGPRPATGVAFTAVISEGPA